MPIVAGDIVYLLSGGAANANPNLSLGGVKSGTAWAGGVLHDFFDIVTGDENAASDIEFRGCYVQNNHATLTWENVVLWLSAETAGGANIGLSVATEAVNTTIQTVANENTSPTGQTFTAPVTKATGLVIGNLAPGASRGFWIRRTATNSAALNSDGGEVTAGGDTAA